MANQEQKKPNILVIWGDDIGMWNLSCYSGGMMGYQTPNIDRIAKEGMRFTDCYGEQSCTAGRSSFITGQSVYRTGLSKVGVPGSPIGLQAEDPTIAELLKPLGIRHRPVRQEPPGRSEQVPADRPRLRRVFRQPVPPERRRGTGDTRLPESEKDFPHFRETLRPARRDALLGDRHGRPHGRAALGPGRQAEDRGHRPAHQEAHGDLRRRVRRRRQGLHQAPAARRQAVFLLGEHHPHALSPTPKPKSIGQAGRWQSPYHDTMIDHDKHVGELLEPAGRARHRERHLRHVQHRQRAAHEHLARRRHDAFPQREEHQLGGRLPRADGWCAGRARSRRASVSNEIVQHHDWLPTFLAMAGEPDIVEKLQEGTQGGGQDVQSAHRRLQLAAVPDRRGEEKPAPGIHLLQRRRRSGRPALRQLESRVHGAAH